MIAGVGVDLFEVSRIEEELRQYGADFGRDVFTPEERAYCDGQRFPAQHYAARFAAKEAAFKALAIDGSMGSPWRDVEVRAVPGGAPALILHGRLKELAERRDVRRVLVSLSHTKTLAAATVILER